ncbi:MAG TPA: rod shape-determining protein RodA [Kiritimatiellia bacterium]|jgi:rod shape determining protein RodA|nr:MAG: Rod shape-determining protein RodA [Verrucomicrobia bacterium ADurb.Bin070]HPB10388.1 rod shape-determining protein RodA [Kiritimatiellia bacterium]HPO36410.1 rod shape-determining protein RodA [Kiritimatiellia bacterium]HQA38556.1 rod shape-determining protein RodA [Kiritimatiellia bacterium]HQL50144.1 rod shape-determining protein RodA [Kiritimatiellia bacterium]
MLKTVLDRFQRLNPLLFACMAGLIVIGVAFVYSACSVREDPELRMLYMRHAEVGVAGLAAYLLLAWVDYRTVIRRWGWLVYLACLVLLILVPLIGEARMGARRWLFGIQPSEPAKLAVVMLLAWLYSRRDAKRGTVMFLLTLVAVGVPAALILAQPDLGTAMVLVPTVFAMLFTARVAPRIVWSCVLAGAAGAALILGLIYTAEKSNLPRERREQMIAMTQLKPHQVRRLQVFLFPDKDLHGSGYNRRQSEIAVGSGGAWGKGYLKGEQYMLGYLPPSVSSNDFIFAVLAEEAGFAGSLTVLLLFLGLLGSGLWVAFRCQNDTGRLFCVGIITLTFSHMFINIAMTIGMMPITGLPLPFISYGRTFMLTMMAAFGIVQSVSIYGRESETRF